MPQAIERSLARPKISAFFPSSKPMLPPKNLSADYADYAEFKSAQSVEDPVYSRGVICGFRLSNLSPETSMALKARAPVYCLTPRAAQSSRQNQGQAFLF